MVLLLLALALTVAADVFQAVRLLVAWRSR